MKFRISLPRLSTTRKGRSRALTLSLLVGISTFALAIFGERLTMSNMASVVVASYDLQPGQTITAADLRSDGEITGKLPSDVITKKDDVIGKSLTYPVKAGQPLIKGLVSETPMRNGLYPGEVGIWVPVSITTSGLVKPGDIVSVYLTPDRNGSNWGQTIQSELVSSLEGVRVVTVINGSGQPIQPNPSNPNANVPVAVQLAIPKENAEAFTQLATGKVSLVLDPFATPKTSMSDIKSPPPVSENLINYPAMPESGMDTNNSGSSITDKNPQYPVQSPPSPPNELQNLDTGSMYIPPMSTGEITPGTYNPPIFNPGE